LSFRYERDDFTVVIQPAFTNIGLFTSPDKKTGKQVKPYHHFVLDTILNLFLQVPDYSYFAPDCLHPSQKLHGLMARALWNNMLTPLGRKSTSWSRDPPFLCPSTSSPYLATRLNSNMANITSMEEDYAVYMQTVRANRIKCYV